MEAFVTRRFAGSLGSTEAAAALAADVRGFALDYLPCVLKAAVVEVSVAAAKGTVISPIGLIRFHANRWAETGVPRLAMHYADNPPPLPPRECPTAERYPVYVPERAREAVA